MSIRTNANQSTCIKTKAKPYIPSGMFSEKLNSTLTG